MISLHILPSSVDAFPDMSRYESVGNVDFHALHARAVAHPDVTEVYAVDLDTGERIAEWEHRRGPAK